MSNEYLLQYLGEEYALSPCDINNLHNQSYAYHLVKHSDGFLMLDDMHYQSKIAPSVAEWQKIRVPLEMFEHVEDVAPLSTPANPTSVFNELRKFTKRGEAYYSPEHLRQLGLKEIFLIDDYACYQGHNTIEFSNGFQFYRPTIPLSTLIWVKEQLYG